MTPIPGWLYHALSTILARPTPCDECPLREELLAWRRNLRPDEPVETPGREAMPRTHTGRLIER
mgnify:CR=1 FL=1